MNKSAAFFALLFAAGCQAPAAKVETVPAPVIVSSYAEKLPGKYLLFVDGSAFNQTIAPQSANCSAYRIPLNASGAFAKAVSDAVAQVVQEVSTVSASPTAADIRGANARGGIAVSANTVDVQFRMIESTGLLNNLEVEISAEAVTTLDTSSSRLHGARLDASGSSSGPAGPICDEGDVRMQEAATKAIRSLAAKIAESIANSQRVRSGV